MKADKKQKIKIAFSNKLVNDSDWIHTVELDMVWEDEAGDDMPIEDVDEWFSQEGLNISADEISPGYYELTGPYKDIYKYITQYFALDEPDIAQDHIPWIDPFK